MLWCWSDTETYSPVNLKKHGVHVYAAHPQCEVLLWPYAVDDGPVKVWDCTAEPDMPADLRGCAYSPQAKFVFHNSHFDRTVLRLTRLLDLPVERIHDTMVQAFAHALPGSLGQLCQALRIPQDQAKSKEGRELILLFCKPHKQKKKRGRVLQPLGDGWYRATRETHPEEWALFVEYARLDVEAMRACAKKMPMWNYRGAELALWHLDQKINDRGVTIDLELAERAVAAVVLAQQELGAQVHEATDGAVQAATQRDALLAHILIEYGVSLPDMRKDTLERRLGDPDLPDAVKELLAIRLQAATSSTSKFTAFINRTSADGRYRGGLQYDGAGRTRRWAGRGVQLQNMPRPSVKADAIEAGIGAIKAGCAHLVHDNVMDLTSNAIRGCIVASPGKKLVVSDLSNIEGRAAAWLANEDETLEAFRQYDAGLAPDLYVQEYAGTFRIPFEKVDGKKRQVGKVITLMLGYEGGVGAFLTGAATYRIDLEEMTRVSLPVLPADVLKEARSFYGWWVVQKGKTDYGLERDVFVVCDALKRLWRQRHPNIVALWSELQIAATRAVLHPGETFHARRLACRRDGAWLRIRLPSGNYLCYPEPVVSPKGELSYMGLNQYTRRWQRIKTYGGKLFENACQALARDVMGANMPAIEAWGYELLLTVHDEVLTEAANQDGFGHQNLSAMLARNPDWAPDLPLAAAGFEAYRYRKD